LVLADTLRTDRARLRPLIPDTATTVQRRSAVRARKDLITHRVGLANQLRAHLEFFHPGPVRLFADLDGITSLRFLTRFTCQDDTHHRFTACAALRCPVSTSGRNRRGNGDGERHPRMNDALRAIWRRP
jgi:hypothetical protein